MGEVTPLRIERLEVTGFRNLDSLVLSPGPRFNVFSGENGAGKSSLLEAIHLLGALRSFRGARTDDLVQLGRQDARIEARIVGDLAPRTFRLGFGRTATRTLSLDGKRPRTNALWSAALPVVIFHPGDLELAAGASERRRAYLDRVLEQMDAHHAPVLAEYEKALRSRNRILRQEPLDRRAIAVYDELLASRGTVVGRARAAIVSDLGPRIEAAFSAIMGEPFPLTVRYRPRVKPEPAAIREALAAALPKDVARGFTADGPHADELAISLRDTAARHHASQGQHRAMALAMKLAELDVLAERTTRVPLLLLDDVSSELDPERNRRLFERIAHIGGQVFLTTTQPELIRLAHHRHDLHVVQGRFLVR